MNKDMNIDIPEKTDYKYEFLFGNTSNKNIGDFSLPEEFIIQNQFDNNITRMGCSRFGFIHISNLQNIFEYKKYGKDYKQLSAINIWLEYLDENPNAEIEGATLQSALKQGLNKGLISGYSTVRTIEEAKDAINNKRYILTGSLNGDWKYVKENHIYRNTDKLIGHIFCIVGYNDNGFLAINSNGADNGIFIIPYEFFDALYTRYAVSDKNDIDIILGYKKYLQYIVSVGLEGYTLLYQHVKGLFGEDSFEVKKLIEAGRARFDMGTGNTPLA